MYKKWLSGYQFVAVQVFTLLLLLLLLNGLLAVFYRYKDQELKQTNPIALKYGREALRKVYPHYSDQAQDALLTETWTRKQEYESFTGFKEAPYQGQYLNVHRAGFRVGWEQGPWPLDDQYLNIFVFGGSTTFGYGVADAETIPSYLQQALSKTTPNVRCYNFGRGFYYSVQERALFEKLLLEGVRPDVVVFLDGLNEYFQEEPEFVDQTKELFDQRPATLLRYWLTGLPVTRLAGSLRYRLTGVSPELKEPDYSCAPDSIQVVHSRYWKNRKMIEAVAQEANIPTFFVWQPISCYQYQPENPLFLTTEEVGTCYPGCGYAQMKKEWDTFPDQNNSLWLADVQRNTNKNLYVDKVHYSAAFHAQLADSLSKELVRKGLVR